ncbi:MAG: LptF/LptG family permease [Candidatus Omnitrophota bacterium]|nr:LptF/LptG family permease [Candidatus Omnitrophota bacterium]
MRILDRYILKSLVSIFVASLLAFCFLYLIIDIFSNLDELIKLKVSLITVRNYYLSFLPIIFSQVAPFACLIASLFSLGKLNSNNELIATRTAGLNFWQITKSVIYFGLIISAVIFAVNEKIVPLSMAISDTIKEEKMSLERKTKEKRQIIKNLTFCGLKNRLYFIDTFDANNNSLQGITILEQDKNQNLSAKIVALKGEWLENNWVFQQCQIFYFDTNGQMNDRIEYFDKKIMDISENPQDFLRQRIQISSMNIHQLKELIVKFSDSGAKSILRNLRVDLHQKIAYPFSNLVIMFVGMPFAMMTKRRKGMTLAHLGIFISIGFFYYVINAIGLAFGKGGLLEPIASAWLANIVFFLSAIYLITKIH